MRGKKLISVLCVLSLCLGMSFQAEASELQEKREQLQELEKDKSAAQQEKDSLSQELETVVAEMEETKARIEAKEAEITAKEEELIQAQIDENDQYESMKKRIKYMYENGGGQFIEVLCEAKDITDFLNKAEYISNISDYDRDMLKQFQDIVADVEAQEAQLQKEYDEMEQMQNELIEKQSTIEALIDEKDTEIGEMSEQLAQLKEAVETAERKQREKAASYSDSAGASVVSGNGIFTHPCPGYSRISSTFGWREQPLPGASTNHKGVDFAAPTGTPIYAAADGTVTSAGYSGNAGNMIIINHGNGLQTYYMHCQQIYVTAGQKVSKGQNIASVGSTGNSTGPHLHFQVMSGGTPVNPMNYL
ncbi:MAG TPA: peptidoglycan DD-metalloendopeptidase family protein [Candidatus Dorea gallistercoris]|uniref:Peptidoglycan DD-metalloendopeptidase family protein n=1 Tax=Candidatus Dorea gallistercoris TaxID=2838542 RepID=A0A9D1R973_9FIRM|nr:peptidoglycan DD-metalloendopeptidase family protein [Candidatus Dorea gallistercoris]